MNPEDVFRDVQKAVIERKRVFVSRSEANGKIRWVIEIENEPFGSQVHSRLQGIFDQFNPRSNSRTDLDRTYRTRGEIGDE
jgi:hypothetical protein